jgi:hypothetical protein
MKKTITLITMAVLTIAEPILDKNIDQKSEIVEHTTSELSLITNLKENL